MPLDRFVLILVCVILAAGLTIWVASLILAGWGQPWLIGALIPVGLIAYILSRVIRDRLSEGDRYDRTPR